MYFSSQNICNLVSVIPTLGQSFQGWLWFPGGQCHYQFFCTGLPDPCAIVSDFTIPSGNKSFSFITFLPRPVSLPLGQGYMCKCRKQLTLNSVSSAADCICYCADCFACSCPRVLIYEVPSVSDSLVKGRVQLVSVCSLCNSLTGHIHTIKTLDVKNYIINTPHGMHRIDSC